MLRFRVCVALAIGGAVLSVLPGRGGAQGLGDDRVYRYMSTDQLEDILKAQNVAFQKSQNLSEKGTYLYVFKRGGYTLRLTYLDGKELVLDNVYAKAATLDRLNEWNKKARFCRASLHQDNAGPLITLQYSLDIVGGITRGTIRQFLNQFVDECGRFESFIGAAAGVEPAAGSETLYQVVTGDVIEQILRKQSITFQKKAGTEGTVAYDFTLGGYPLRLTSYGGKDLMIDAIFKKLSLRAVNDYNVNRKFVRAVYYNTGSKEYTALESNFDCTAGVTEDMVRFFVAIFPTECKTFAAYVNNQP
jgi:hypothetical protein